ncbi:MAG: hypothetical protein ISS79_02390 [Phycisphaerae bacterium]|nr:hypothetical protein [Phycisphaerae bacterium]
MRKAKRTILIAMLICVVTVPVCWAGSDKLLSARELLKTMREKDRQAAQRSGTRHTPANKSHPSVSELLDKYAETQDKLQSLIIKSETSTYGASTSAFGRLPRIPKGGSGGFHELRFDGKRVYWYASMWGHVGMRAEPIPRDTHHLFRLWDGKVFFKYAVSDEKDKYASSPFGTVKIYDYKNNVEKGQNIYKGFTRLPLQGYCHEDKERVDVMLRQADNLSVRNKLERIGGSDCYVIDAKGKHGTYRVWIDPAHGYNIAQAEVRRTTGDLRGGNPMGGGAKLFYSLKNIRFQKIDNVWIPVEADRKINQTYGGGRFWRSSGHIKRTEVIINPDHEALGSFLPDDIRNGAYVKIMDFPIKPHNIWRDGKFVTSAHFIWRDGKCVDEDGREVDVDKLIKAESEKVKKP